MAWLCKNEACTIIKRSNDICLTEYLLNKRFLDEVCLRDKWQIRPELIARFQYHDAISSISTPRRWDASPSQGYPQHYIRRYLFIHLEGDTHCVRVKCLAEEHNTMSPARARVRNARSGVERANHGTPSLTKKAKLIHERLLVFSRLSTDH